MQVDKRNSVHVASAEIEESLIPRRNSIGRIRILKIAVLTMKVLFRNLKNKRHQLTNNAVSVRVQAIEERNLFHGGTQKVS